MLHIMSQTQTYFLSQLQALNKFIIHNFYIQSHASLQYVLSENDWRLGRGWIILYRNFNDLWLFLKQKYLNVTNLSIKLKAQARVVVV